MAQATDQDQELWKLRAEHGKKYRIWRSGGQLQASRNALDPRVMQVATAAEMDEILSADRQAWVAESRSR
jgi:hypothetical protein